MMRWAVGREGDKKQCPDPFPKLCGTHFGPFYKALLHLSLKNPVPLDIVGCQMKCELQIIH